MMHNQKTTTEFKQQLSLDQKFILKASMGKYFSSLLTVTAFFENSFAARGKNILNSSVDKAMPFHKILKFQSTFITLK